MAGVARARDLRLRGGDDSYHDREEVDAEAMARLRLLVLPLLLPMLRRRRGLRWCSLVTDGGDILLWFKTRDQMQNDRKEERNRGEEKRGAGV